MAVGSKKVAIRLASLAVLAWFLQACCCGEAPPKPGPPGAINGQIQPAPGPKPGPLTIYAVNSDAMGLTGHPSYVALHLPPPATTYTLSLPPGYYLVVARLDSDPTGGAGHTFNMACIAAKSCGGNAGNTTVTRVRVESLQTLPGIDIGDWGTPSSEEVLWRIDSHGTPLPLNPEPSPSPKSLPSRSLPAPSADPGVELTSSLMGLKIHLRATWTTLGGPGRYGYSDAYATSEKVRSPLELDKAGVWLDIELFIQDGCPFPDWRFATATATVSMQGGSNNFFFEDPAPRDGPQPYTGYSVRGGESIFGNCIEFTLTASTESALKDNLPTFTAIVQGARFAQICTSCPPDLHSPTP
jgi:hypothetical protein